jgi:hypothetical protein
MHVKSIIMRIELNRGNDNIYPSSKKCNNGSNVKAGWGDFEGATCVDHGHNMCATYFSTPRGNRQGSCPLHEWYNRSLLTEWKGYSNCVRHPYRHEMKLPQGKPSTKATTRWLGQIPQTMWFVHKASAERKYDNNVRSRPDHI